MAPGSTDFFRRELSESVGGEAVESLDEYRILCRTPMNFRSLFWLHRFPVGLEQTLPDLGLEMVREVIAAAELPFERLQVSPFGIQLGANGRLPWSFSDLVDGLLQRLEMPREKFRPRSPQTVLSAYFHHRGGECRIFAGVSTTRENLSPWDSGQCRMPRDPDAVSRAEAKLLEAWESFGMSSVAPVDGPAARALDLGAAPGGWSRILSAKGYQVHAVDPAELDPRVLSLPGITHYAQTAAVFLRRSDHRYDLLVSDMKMEAAKAAALLSGSVSFLRPGGRLLATLKLGKGASALTEARRALAILERAYTILTARQLYFNRSEITVYAQPRAEAGANLS